MQGTGYSVHQMDLQQFTAPDSAFIFPENVANIDPRGSFSSPSPYEDYPAPYGWSPGPKSNPPPNPLYSSTQPEQRAIPESQSSWLPVADQQHSIPIAQQSSSPVDYRVDLNYTLPSAPSIMQAPQPIYPTQSMVHASYPPAPGYQVADGTATSAVAREAFGHSRDSSWVSTTAMSAYTVHPEEPFSSPFDDRRSDLIGGQDDVSPCSEQLNRHYAPYDAAAYHLSTQKPPLNALGAHFSVQSVPASCISRTSSLANWNELPSTSQTEYYHAVPQTSSYDASSSNSANIETEYLPPPHYPYPLQEIREDQHRPRVQTSVPPVHDDTTHNPQGPSSSVIPRRSHLEIVRSSPHVRQAAKLRVDVGLADITSPQSHEARLQQRRRRSGTALFSPYERPPPVVPSSTPSSSDAPHPKQKRSKKKKASTKTTEQYGAQRTFIFNPYDYPAVVAVGDDATFMREDFPPPLPEPCNPNEVTGRIFPETEPTLQQTIRLSDPPSPDASLKKHGYDERHTGIDPATGEKKPFLACGFCRQRKICCGQRSSHPLDHDLPEGPRTCNQCARRGLLCSYPSESRRGLRKAKPVERIVWRDGQQYRVVEGGDAEDDACDPSVSGKKSKKGRNPLEWIIAVDAAVITSEAWESYEKDPIGQGRPIYPYPTPPRHPANRRRGSIAFKDQDGNANIIMDAFTHIIEN